MKVKWYGTATLVFSAEGKTILFDPFSPMNRELPRPDLSELAGCGDIFITHGHFDHLIDVPQVVAAGGGPVFCSEVAAETLLREGVDIRDITVLQPGKPVERGPFKVTAFKGEHIRFDLKLILQTLFNRRVISYRRNLGALLKGAVRYPKGEVLVFLIEAAGKRVLHLGSLSLDEDERYPEEVDILTIPYQGRSDLVSYALPFIRRIQPKTIYLHHFDDSFPPVSSPVEVQPFVDAVTENFPGIGIVLPEPLRTIAL